ncbi:MAG TPA: hypothetical protein VHP34_04205, partial [Alphaproteobacteria bacterium]|nr:hypothetical protein [Alphaproteobacteria bacterium]
MSKKKDPAPETPPAAPTLPDALHDFIKAISPADQKPTEELTARFKKESVDNTRGFIVPGSPKSGPEYLVELRIREWMYRMEREAADQRRQAQNNNRQ